MSFTAASSGVLEPTAAAISYITESADDLEDKKLLVVDIGGGTFDLSYLQYNSDKNEYVKLRSLYYAVRDVVYRITESENLIISGLKEVIKQSDETAEIPY